MKYFWTEIEGLKRERDWTDLDVARAIGKKSKAFLSNIRRGHASGSAKAAAALADLLVSAGRIRPGRQREQIILQIQGVLPANPRAESAA